MAFWNWFGIMVPYSKIGELYRIRRFSSEGSVECDNKFLLTNEGFEINKEFELHILLTVKNVQLNKRVVFIFFYQKTNLNCDK